MPRPNFCRSAWLAPVLAGLLMAGCASDAATGYPTLPGSTATTAPKVLTPAEQQKAIDDLNAAKAQGQ